MRRMILGEWSLWRRWLGLGRPLFGEGMENGGVGSGLGESLMGG